MPEYLAPGVYVEEIEIGAKPIEGVSTSTAGFLGQTERGPIGTRLVTGFEQFMRLYGGYIEKSYLAYAVEGFFRNGGQRCFIGRIVGGASGTSDAKPSEAELIVGMTASKLTLKSTEGKDTIEVKALHPGTQGDKIKVKVADAKTTGKDLFKLIVTGGSKTEPYDNLSSSLSSDDYYVKRVNGVSELVVLEQVTPGVPAKKDATSLSGGIDGWIKVKALGPGTWGNRIEVKVTDASLQKDGLFKLIVVYGKDAAPTEEEGKLVGVSVTEIYDNLSSEPSSSDYYAKRVNGVSNLVVLEQVSTGTPSENELTQLSEGNDGGEITSETYQGVSEDPEKRSGLKAFEGVDEISIVCIPDENEVTGLTSALVDHCENMKDRFAIIQSEQSAVGTFETLRPPKDSKYAAFYYPWIKVLDPLTNMYKLVPPGGHITGVYARSDQERGVHKAPANEVLRGVSELQVNVSKGDQDMLNPRGVNCIRAFPGRGIRVWGARTTSNDSLWKYVNVRRLFLFIEESVDEGTQWAVFEPNDEKLWARVAQTVTQFLNRVWRDGALMGTTQDEAFFVKCDRTTMTQDDIDNGRLIMLIGVAPVKPAEFVIIRIAQVAKGSEISE